MADKSISELVAATAVGSTDLFVLEQTGTAKKLTGQILENWLVSFADGHGGIHTFEKTGTSGLVDTYTITYADTTTSTITVTNGKSISSITQYWAVSESSSTVPSQWYTTRQTMTVTNKYLWSYMHYAYNDETSYDTPYSVIGVYGDTGAQTYVWIKYAGIRPTSNADMGDTPDNWIGIYVGLSATAPTSYTAYTWYQYKGEQGDVGDPARLNTASVSYQISQSGAVVPDGSWSTNIPTPVQGAYLWTRIVLEFNTGTPVTFYSVSRYGLDGTGSVVAINGVSPDPAGTVTLTAGNIPYDSTATYSSGTVGSEIKTLDYLTKRNYILLGDSFSIGYTTNDGSTYRQTAGGWANYAKTILTEQGHEVYTSNDIQASVSGATGFASSLPFLTLLQDLEEVIPNKDIITDIIVLGGTNDIGHEAGIEDAIDNFVEYVKENYPSAKIKIGCLGSQMGTIYGNIAPHYKHCSLLGCEYIDDLVFLFCQPQYYCVDGVHLTEEGYNVYRPYIMEAILTGSTHYNLSATYTLKKVNSVYTEIGATPSLILQFSPHAITYFVQSSAPQYALEFTSYVSNDEIYSITPTLRIPSYYAKFAQTMIFGIGSNTTHLKGVAYPYLTENRFNMLRSVNNPDGATISKYYMYLNQTAYTQFFR